MSDVVAALGDDSYRSEATEVVAAVFENNQALVASISEDLVWRCRLTLA